MKTTCRSVAARLMKGYGGSMPTLENIPVSLDTEEIGRRLHMDRKGDWSLLLSLVEAARPLMRARALYRVCYVEAKSEDAVVIEGTRLSSRLLRRHLDKVERVFPYVLTIGRELEDMAAASGDLLHQFYLDAIGNAAISAARGYLEDQVKSKYALAGMSYMAPGSLKDWPITEQKFLFTVLGDVKSAIGVSLTESMLMIPRKSVSGVYFPTEIPFYSCQLCPREACPSRKAPFDEKLAMEYKITKTDFN